MYQSLMQNTMASDCKVFNFKSHMKFCKAFCFGTLSHEIKGKNIGQLSDNV